MSRQAQRAPWPRPAFAERPSGWRRWAACRGADTELWFGHAQERDALQARAICTGCPVVGECLEWALATGQQYGTWGGISAGTREWRQAVRARRERAA